MPHAMNTCHEYTNMTNWNKWYKLHILRKDSNHSKARMKIWKWWLSQHEQWMVDLITVFTYLSGWSLLFSPSPKIWYDLTISSNLVLNMLVSMQSLNTHLHLSHSWHNRAPGLVITDYIWCCLGRHWTFQQDEMQSGMRNNWIALTLSRESCDRHNVTSDFQTDTELCSATTMCGDAVICNSLLNNRLHPH